MTFALQIQEHESVYDFAWYPFMNSAQPESACFVSSSRDQPIHCWDAFSGALRCSYRVYNHMDEVTSIYSLAFSRDGTSLYAGRERAINVFDITRPGRDSQSFVFAKRGGLNGMRPALCLMILSHVCRAVQASSRR
jgi:hypothetical protein